MYIMNVQYLTNPDRVCLVLDNGTQRHFNLTKDDLCKLKAFLEAVVPIRKMIDASFGCRVPSEYHQGFSSRSGN